MREYDKIVSNNKSHNMSHLNFKQAIKSLSKDPVMAYLADQFGHEITLNDRYETDHAKALALLVIEQQVSFKAAQTIKERFLKLIHSLDHTQIMDLDHEILRSIGISQRKVDYIKNIYHHFIEKPRDYSSKSNQCIKQSLIKIKGIGPWTIEMFLIFIMGATDIFSKGDLALINSIKKNYEMDSLNDQYLDHLIQSWRPYNTVASLLLWCSVEQKIFYPERP